MLGFRRVSCFELRIQGCGFEVWGLGPRVASRGSELFVIAPCLCRNFVRKYIMKVKTISRGFCASGEGWVESVRVYRSVDMFMVSEKEGKKYLKSGYIQL